MPDVVVSSYATSWMKWWVYLQPKWRGEELLCEVPEDPDWSELRKGGPNGFFIILISFAWWGQAINLEDDLEAGSWFEAYEDIRWVLGQLSELEDEDLPVAKKCVISFIYCHMV